MQPAAQVMCSKGMHHAATKSSSALCHHGSRIAFLALALRLWTGEAASQELEPRAFSPAPIGTKFLLSGFGGSRGAYVVDAAVPVENVQAEVSFALLAGGYTFNLAGHQARLLALLPYAWGGVSGDISGEQRSRALEGFGDARLKLSVGLVGAPPLTLEEFAQTPRRTVIGTSLTIMPPVGQYDAGRLINLGFNRWAFKPEIGIWHPAGPWTFDGSVGVWLFTANKEYFPGTAEREQAPIIALQGHVSRDFRSGIWLALDGAWFWGGQTRVDGVAIPDRRDSGRLGVTLSLPMSAQQSLKFTYSTGIATQRGGDFDTLGVTWQIVMF
jgi:hypothetical protein